jgi:hypothetical protein
VAGAARQGPGTGGRCWPRSGPTTSGPGCSCRSRSQSPDGAWLRSHRWVWSQARIEEVLAEGDGAVFVCGFARNLDEFPDLFDRVFLVHVDGPTQQARLIADDAVYAAGRSEAGREEIRDGRAVFEAERLRLGAIALDGAAPTAKVAAELLALIAAT